jgi:dCMP deaminase
VTPTNSTLEYWGKMLHLAYDQAEKSGDRSTQNGAVLLDALGEHLIGRGCNDIPAPSCTDPNRRNRPLKYSFTGHAERCAIYNAARYGKPVDGSTLFVCWAACDQCALAMVFSGVRRLIRHVPVSRPVREDWQKSITLGDTILNENGVEIVDYREHLGRTVLFDGSPLEV